jgi:hypothetical protein
MFKIIKAFFTVIIGLIFPILFFLLFWWSSFLLGCNDKTISILALTGLGMGLLIDFVIHLFWKINIYQIPETVLIAVYVFYSLCMFGFFMGVPVFHPLLGIMAGYYWAKRILFYKYPYGTYKSEIKRVSRFTAIVMGAISLCSAAIALIDKYTTSNLKGMLNLPFDIPMPWLVISIVLGGLLLIWFQYRLTKIVMTKLLNY